MYGIDFHTLILIAIAILVVIWLIGLISRGAKRLIHIFLIVAVLLVLYNFFLR
jgi:hypothetical protein